ncbi:hypothetical protein QO011_005503 [Labrys wisconsinensis]|uniref:Uncharacterized protein n=1 Tax=Labrys wisconsinensis TaxID=425677 RepID=A0ABU0JDX2_9HYPH|nr:hypothetical protein [Labrys wisconsinensis]
MAAVSAGTVGRAARIRPAPNPQPGHRLDQETGKARHG